jgi:hypothetical protein
MEISNKLFDLLLLLFLLLFVLLIQPVLGNGVSVVSGLQDS